jgi:UDP-N-acetylglucosamine 4-epimerase
LSSLGEIQKAEIVFREFRPGDVRHSQADISKAQRLLGYVPEYSVREGLAATMGWYRSKLTAEVMDASPL